MTAVIIAPRVENPLNDTESVASKGYIQIRPSKAYVAGGQWVQPAWSGPITLAGAAITVQLDPLPSVPYELFVSIVDGKNNRVEFSEFRIVPSSGSAVAWETLTQVSGPSGDAVLTGTDQARLTALEVAVGSVSGGASNLGSITDMSPFMRTVNDDVNAATVRTDLNVPAVGDAPTAHTHAVPGGLVATGTPSSTTFLRGDGAWAAVSATADLTGVPWYLGTTAGSYPPRPATTRPVIFTDPNVMPANTGSTSGGGGMVPTGSLPGGLSDMWIS